MYETEVKEIQDEVSEVVKPISKKLKEKSYPGAKLLVEKIGNWTHVQL